jgi:hypothetical protein
MHAQRVLQGTIFNSQPVPNVLQSAKPALASTTAHRAMKDTISRHLYFIVTDALPNAKLVLLIQAAIHAVITIISAKLHA